MSKPTAVFFTDGSDVGVQCARILAQHPVTIIAGVVSRLDDACMVLSAFPSAPLLYTGSHPETDARLMDAMGEGVDFLFSCWYDRRVPSELLSRVRKAAVNLHPAYLPWNRGRHSAFWGILDGTPLGATIHHMDEGLDTGDIIAQEVLEDDGVMSAQEVYLRQSALCVKLFREWLPAILDGSAPRRPQGQGTYHHAGEIREATRFDDLRTVTMGQLVRLARATSFGEHGFHVRLADGRLVKVKARVELA